MRRVLIALLALMWALPVQAQLPPGEGIIVDQTPVQGGTAAQCLYIKSNATVGSQACSTGSVTTFSAGTTGLTPSSPTSGAIVLAGTLIAGNGGTGIASYAIGDLLYASGAAALSKLAGVATGNVLLSGGVTTAPAWGKVDLTAAVSGALPVANGGTGAATLAAAQAVLKSNFLQVGKLIGADFNSTADQAITLTCPTAKIKIQLIAITNPSTDLSTATIPLGGFYTAASKGGVALVAAAQSYAALTNATNNTVGNWLQATNISTVVLDCASLATPNTIYFALSTAHGSAATADIYVTGIALY